MNNSIVILDFGSQYTQLIARRIRELHVYCEIFPWDHNSTEVLVLDPAGYILSGGPASVYDPQAPTIPAYVLESSRPILGICYGMQALARSLGGQVVSAGRREYGLASIHVEKQNPLLPDEDQEVWMSHGDRIETLPAGFESLASSANSPMAAMGDPKRRIYGVQFHPEVRHTRHGKEILRRFVMEICACRPDWTPENIIQRAIHDVQETVGDETALAAVSGGVDSSVAVALVHRAIGNRLSSVFVDTGLLRQGEVQQVKEALAGKVGANLRIADAAGTFLSNLRGVTDPEQKRHIIGSTFIRIFEREAERLGRPPFLVQGTIYPDVVESRAPERPNAQRIKSHHNVGGLPDDMYFHLIEPLRYLFKDEVRAVGEALGLPPSLVWRQPFPGPGLAVRCLGEITPQRIAKLQAADAIFLEELTSAGWLRLCRSEDAENLAQAFVVLLPVRSVGVMGDQRTYDETAVLRAVTSEDFMTADWARLPHDLLGRVSARIINEVGGINRVVYDVTSKPPATIEWE